MFFVEARYHPNPEKVPQQIRYISHREERLPSGERPCHALLSPRRQNGGPIHLSPRAIERGKEQ